MSKKIIVAGAGHGGIAAAALLSRVGMDVTVYERSSEGTLGYDWTDIFAPCAWKAAGIEMPSREKYEYKTNMTFYSPNLQTPLEQHIPEDEIEMKMERRDIYEHLINHALKCGVKFVYDCNISAPILFGNRVVGIKTERGDFFADLVIDAAGIDSPLRTNLPRMCGIEKTPGAFGQLYVYRAFYNRSNEEDADVKYKIYLLPNGELGIGWVAAEENFTDLLIGKFDPYDSAQAEKSAEFFRQTNSNLGSTLLRGGQITKIPVRQPLSVMVCDGYAAIGDSAFMTMPIIGSGIANSLKASRMLADTVLADKAGAYSAETLWDYQVKYFRQIGAGLAQIACIKSLLLNITPEELDCCFEKGILTADNFAIGSDSSSLADMIKMTPNDMKNRAQALLNEKELLKKVLALGIKIAKVTALTQTMPQKWNRSRVSNWSKQYCKVFSI